ncbi:trimethylamine methyltransferase family protein, partial [Calditrichota bacterium]
DAQAGLETAMGATLAALSGINNISGPGMLDFESCQSLEKLILDNEICGQTLRMAKGIEPKEDFPADALFKELLEEKHLLISKHTRKYLREEHYFTGPVINRANKARWLNEGSTTFEERAHAEVEKLLQSYTDSALEQNTKSDLIKLMETEAKRFGMDKLPARTE